VENPGTAHNCHAYPAHGGIKMRIVITEIYRPSFRLEKSALGNSPSRFDTQSSPTRCSGKSIEGNQEATKSQLLMSAGKKG
jgi:hypothetical protein